MEASVLVVAVNDPKISTQIVRYARTMRPDLHIVARARDRVHVYELYQAGANDTVRETFDSAVRAGRYVLENVGYSEYEASKLSQTFWRMDRQAMRGLAEVWVPGQPVDKNEAYIRRSQELEQELEAAIMGEIYEVRPLEVTADLIEVDSTPLLAFSRALGLHSRGFHRCTYLDWRDHLLKHRRSSQSLTLCRLPNSGWSVQLVVWFQLLVLSDREQW
jgi:hypothetical protein